MGYEEFYDIADYGNINWRGNFTPKEVATNACIYYEDYLYSQEHKVIAESIKNLAKLLIEDGSVECKEWIYQIADGLGLIDMDWQDFIDTDAWLTVL